MNAVSSGARDTVWVLKDLSGNLGRYSFGDGLGPPGGYGAAFRALRDDGLPCVVKLIHGFFNPSAQDLDRLRVMLEHLATVESDHVVPIIDAGVDRTAAGVLPWIAMPEIPGARALREVIAESAVPLGPAVARRIGIGVARGLADLHAANMLHRDVKPGNLLLGEDGQSWLIDFELAKIQQLTTRTSRVAEPLGTELYMAPEQLRGPVVPETDLWALGLVLVELLTGRQPVRAVARRQADVRRVILSDSLVPEGLPGEWHELIDALLRKVPSARPDGAQSVVEWLEAGRRQLPTRLVRQSPRWRWEVRSLDDVAAAEDCSGEGLGVAAIDARGRARSSRLRRAARALPVALAFEPVLNESAQLSLDGLRENAVLPNDQERAVFEAMRAQCDADTDEVLLPWTHVDAGDIGEAIEVLRIGLRQRGVAAGKPVVATVQLSAGAVTNRADALELASVLCALRPDGWRLLVDGLQPGCGRNVLMATADMACALASRADVWVRASGLARWFMSTLPGVSVLARSGRGLWTRGAGYMPSSIPERVEVPLLAGPVPRVVADGLADARPALLACDCRICSLPRAALPSCGAPTIAHNVMVVDGQLAMLHELPAGLRSERVAELLHAAMRRRATLPELINWDGELDDLDDVLAVVEGRAHTRRAGFRLLRFA